jgi:hypothetical protein
MVETQVGSLPIFELKVSKPLLFEKPFLDFLTAISLFSAMLTFIFFLFRKSILRRGTDF